MINDNNAFQITKIILYQNYYTARASLLKVKGYDIICNQLA